MGYGAAIYTGTKDSLEISERMGRVTVKRI
jgi:hypothetical protein